MKRMHVHVAVDDLAANIKFYSTLFGMPPALEKPDYAKWMLEDPRVNFAISARGLNIGVDHLGIQVDAPEELAALRDQLDAAGQAMLTQEGTTCCYARSDKHWVADPQGIAWETYHTLGDSPTFGESKAESKAVAATDDAGACCSPTSAAAPTPIRFVRNRPTALTK